MESTYATALKATNSAAAVCKVARAVWELNKTHGTLVAWFDAAYSYYYATRGAVQAASTASMGETVVRRMIDLRGEAFDEMANVIAVLKGYIDSSEEAVSEEDSETPCVESRITNNEHL
jgi:hypothetical protein